MSLILPALAFAALIALSGSTKSTPKQVRPPLPDGDFDYMEEDDGDLILEEDDTVYEGSGYADMPIAQMKAVQYYLSMLDYYGGEIHGRYTDATEQAIAEFQSFVNLPETGEPDQATLGVLADVANNIIEQYDTFAEEDAVVPTPAPVEPEEPGYYAPNEVACFGYTECQVGMMWPYTVLGSWLEGRRQNGMLQTRFDEISANTFEDLYGEELEDTIDTNWELWFGGSRAKEESAMLAGGLGLAAFGLAEMGGILIAGTGIGVFLATGIVATYGQAAYKKGMTIPEFWGAEAMSQLIAATGTAAVAEFIQTHYVHTENGSVRIIDLPNGLWKQRFIEYITRQVAYFQASAFE